MVVGRPGVNVHAGMPTTAQIEGSAILLDRRFLDIRLYPKYEDLAQKMSAANNNVPIIFFNKLRAGIVADVDDQYDYLKSSEGVSAIKFVYEKYLSKPFTMANIPDLPASSWDVFLDTPSGKIHRPNHGLAHTLRVANAMGVIAGIYNSMVNLEEQIPRILIYRKQFGSLFSVIGRTNDIGFQEALDYQEKTGSATSIYEL